MWLFNIYSCCSPTGILSFPLVVEHLDMFLTIFVQGLGGTLNFYSFGAHVLVEALSLDRVLLPTLPFQVFVRVVPPSCWWRWNLTFGHVREFTHAIKAFARLASVPTSLEMVCLLQALHLLNLDSPCLNSLLDFQLNTNVELFMDYFKLDFLCMSHL